MRSFLCWLPAAVGLAFASVAIAQPGPASAPLIKPHMKEDVRQFFKAVRDGHSYVDEKRVGQAVDLNRLEAAAYERVETITSDAEFHALLKELVAALRDGHCEAISSASIE
jgi:hypothetical protein